MQLQPNRKLRHTLIRFWQTVRTLILGFLIVFMIPIPCFATKQDIYEFASPVYTPLNINSIVYHAFRKMGLDATVKTLGFNNALISVNSGEIDGIMTQTMSIADRYPDLIQVPVKINDMKFIPLIREGFEKPITDWNSLEGLAVGYLYQRPYIQANLPQTIQKSVQKLSYPLLWEALQRGEIDVVVMPKMEGQYIRQTPGILQLPAIDMVDSFIYLNKKNEDLVQPLTEVLTEMKNDGTIDQILYHPNIPMHKEQYILYISSESADTEWDFKMLEGLSLNSLSGYQIDSIYLDLNLVDDTLTQEQNANNMIWSGYLGKVPSAIVVSDDVSLLYLANNYSSLFYGVPVVFCGINGFEENWLYDYEDLFTGVLETDSTSQTMEVMLQLFPQTKNVFVLNDYTQSGQGWRKSMQKNLAPYEDRIQFEYNENLGISELLAKLKKLPPNTLVLCGEYNYDSTMRYYPDYNIQSLLYEHSNSPLFGLKTTAFGYGQVGGKMIDPQKHGDLTRSSLLKVLEREQNVPIASNTESQNVWLFDNAVMRKWGVSPRQINALVPASFINERQLLFRYNSMQLFFSAVILCVSIGALIGCIAFYWIMKKRNSELQELQKSLHSAEEMLEKDSEIIRLKDYFEKIVQTAPIGYALVVDSVITEANPFMIANTGIKLLQSVHDNEIFKALFENDSPRVTEKRLADDKIHRVVTHSIPIEDNGNPAHILWCVDLEENEQQADILERFEKELMDLMDHLPIALCILDKDNGTLQYVNKAYLTLFEFDNPDEILGQKMTAIYAGNQEEVEDSINRYSSRLSEHDGRLSNRECEYISKNGKSIQGYTYDCVSYFKGKLSIICLIKDITDEKKYALTLQSMAEKEKETSKLKSRFLINMSHEIRTPMNAIIGLSELQVTKYKDGPGYQSLKKIYDSANQLLTIINDILDYSKIEAQKFELVEDDFNLEQAIWEVYVQAKEAIGAKKIKIGYSIKQGVPHDVLGDRFRFIQILNNIANNAVQNTEVGSIHIEATPYESSHDRNGILFVVQDTGRGMSPEQIERVSIPFERFADSSRPTSSGTGLGIPIVESIASLMDGWIRIQSKPDEGTKVSMLLYFKKSTGVSVIQPAVVQEPSKPADLQLLEGARIVVCDDVEINQEVALAVLEHYGSIGSAVSSGFELLDFLNTEKVDLILLDVNMPGLDGYQTAEEIRARGYTLPIIAMTGNTSMDDIGHCLKAGMNSHIEKPIDLVKFGNEVSIWLSKG